MPVLNLRPRAAIEGLRSGVPSRHAVAQLGTTQTEIQEAFGTALSRLGAGQPGRPLVISANFGSGKTHLLEYLQSVSEDQGFATSYVVVSAEMPLGNAGVVLKTLAESARAPGRTGKAMRALTADLPNRSEAFDRLRVWANQRAELNDRFRALLHLFEEFASDPELRVQILGDFEGKPLLKTLITQKLKELGATAAYDLKGGPRNALLAHDRIEVYARMLQACGTRGLVVLFDELERVARFTKKQRLAAYEELGWWSRIAAREGSYILPVFAMTSNYYSNVLEDEATLVNRQGVLFEHDDRDLLAREGVEVLKDHHRLTNPTAAEIETVRYRIRALYQEAYGVTVPETGDDGYYSEHDPIRQRIRRWITQWDLHRFYPDETHRIEVEDVRFDEHDISDEELTTNGDDDA